MLKTPSHAQHELEMVSLEELVPKDHLLRLIERHIRFDFIREQTAHLYCADNGRPALDPVTLFQMLFIGYLFGVRFERQGAGCFHAVPEAPPDDEPPPKKEVKVSPVDPEAGYMVRDGKPTGFFYLDHRTVDGVHAIITDTHVTAANVHDSQPCLGRTACGSASVSRCRSSGSMPVTLRRTFARA